MSKKSPAFKTDKQAEHLRSEALSSYVADEQDFLSAVEHGKKALREGKIVNHAAVVEAFERIIEPRR